MISAVLKFAAIHGESDNPPTILQLNENTPGSKNPTTRQRKMGM
jgi:hypothetical protein